MVDGTHIQSMEAKDRAAAMIQQTLLRKVDYINDTLNLAGRVYLNRDGSGLYFLANGSRSPVSPKMSVSDIIKWLDGFIEGVYTARNGMGR